MFADETGGHSTGRGFVAVFPRGYAGVATCPPPIPFCGGARIQHFEKSSARNWNASRIFFRDALIFTHKRFGYGARLMLWGLTRPLWLAMWAQHHLSAKLACSVSSPSGSSPSA
ncbi:MAG UNVERIFIED_CONTAM: hypothetical protein LVT10_05980 [Anaerolineae bacterium]